MGDKHTKKILIKADPEPIEIYFNKTAILVVDMQNAFVSKGGYFDSVGVDISAVKKTIGPCQKIIGAGREKGIKVIYLQMGWSQDLFDQGPPESPSAYKSKIPALLKQRPELKDKLYIYGTWGAHIIDELKPMEGDIVIRKQRYDGFIGTNLDLVLRSLGIKYLLFAGTASNICVESTLRHAFFLDYFPILISDTVSQKGSEIMQQATIFNVQSTFGWVTTSKNLLHAFGQIKNGSSIQKTDG